MAKIQQMGVDALYQAMQNKDDYVLVDVREPDEWAEGIIDGSLLVSLGDVDDASENWDKDKTYYLFCRIGGRSLKACHALSKKGFSNLTNIAQGMLGWQQKGYPVIKK